VEAEFEPEAGGTAWVEYFKPLCMYPMPDVLQIPQRCPKDVAKSLRSSFTLMWVDPQSSANHIRSALEELLDHLGVQHRKKRRDGKFAELSLHARIEIFSKTNPVSGAHLMALKWIGNTGSHGGNVYTDEILDAYEVLEHVLQDIVEQRTKRVNELAKKMTRRHGSRRR
jgi:hypothetical protein